jgi:hypothetical protein
MCHLLKAATFKITHLLTDNGKKLTVRAIRSTGSVMARASNTGSRAT